MSPEPRAVISEGRHVAQARWARADASCVAATPDSNRGPGFLWWAFNSFVCVVGGLWMLSFDFRWGLLVILLGLPSIPLAARKLGARHWL
jgi:hypothetical protein